MNAYTKIISDFLKSCGGSMVDLARRLGLPRQAVYDWCRRGSLRLSHLERIAAAYGWRVRVVFEPVQEGQEGPQNDDSKN